MRYSTSKKLIKSAVVFCFAVDAGVKLYLLYYSNWNILVATMILMDTVGKLILTQFKVN